jgi:general secretion pathway protein G
MKLKFLSRSQIDSAPQMPQIAVSEAGFSLLEIIIVLGIIGTLMAVVFNTISSSQQSAKIKETTVRAGSITSQIVRYQTDIGKMPTTSEGLGILVSNPSGNGKWAGPYLQESDTKDGFGNDFTYELTPAGPKLTSPGKDGQAGTEDDLVYINGRAVEAEANPPAANPAP